MLFFLSDVRLCLLDIPLPYDFFSTASVENDGFSFHCDSLFPFCLFGAAVSADLHILTAAHRVCLGKCYFDEAAYCC